MNTLQWANMDLKMNAFMLSVFFFRFVLLFLFNESILCAFLSPPARNTFKHVYSWTRLVCLWCLVISSDLPSVDCVKIYIFIPLSLYVIVVGVVVVDVVIHDFLCVKLRLYWVVLIGGDQTKSILVSSDIFVMGKHNTTG